MIAEHRTAISAQERVQISSGVRADIALGDPGEREVEQHQLPGPVGPLEDPEVLRFQVPVPHTLGRQLVQRGE